MSVEVRPISNGKAKVLRQRLLPLPHEMSVTKCIAMGPEGIGIMAGHSVAEWAVDRLRRLFREKAGVGATGKIFEIHTQILGQGEQAEVRPFDGRLYTVPNADQAYCIRPIEDRGLVISGLTARGVMYGAITLAQMLEGDIDSDLVSIPLVSIMDWPDFDERGFWHMPMSIIPHVAELKLNQCHSVTYFEAMSDGGLRLHPGNNGEDNAEVEAYWAGPFARARACGVDLVPGIIHMDFWERRCEGLAALYPDIVGQGEQAKGGAFATHGFRVPCTSGSRLRTVLADLMKKFVASGVLDVHVWVSEFPGGQCQCAECREIGQFQGEVRAAVEAWQEVRHIHPDLKLRIFFGAGGFAPNEKWSPDYPRHAVEMILAELPREVRLCVSLGIDEDQWETYIKHGGVLTRCFVVSMYSWNYASCSDVRTRLQDLHARGVQGVSQYWNGTIGEVSEALDLQLAALAEYSWNVKGRTISQFAEAWAARRGDRDPSSFGRWVSLVSHAVGTSSSMDSLLRSGSWLRKILESGKGDASVAPHAVTEQEPSIEVSLQRLEWSKYFEAKSMSLDEEIRVRQCAFREKCTPDDRMREFCEALELATHHKWGGPSAYAEMLLRYVELESAGMALLEAHNAATDVHDASSVRERMRAALKRFVAVLAKRGELLDAGVLPEEKQQQHVVRTLTQLLDVC